MLENYITYILFHSLNYAVLKLINFIFFIKNFNKFLLKLKKNLIQIFIKN